jgi:hypothetical protein
MQGLAFWAFKRRWSGCMHIQNERLLYTWNGDDMGELGDSRESKSSEKVFRSSSGESCIYFAFWVATLSRYTW